MYRFKNFKGFAKAELDLSSPFTILIGPNGAGKSNAIEGMKLLSFLARGFPLYEVSDVGRKGKLEIRGNLQSCALHGNSEFELGYGYLKDFFSVRLPNFDYSIVIKVKPQPRIAEESLHFEDTMIFETVSGPDDAADIIPVRYNNFARGGKKPQERLSVLESVLSRYKELTALNEKCREYAAKIESIRKLFSNILFFNPVPGLMRDYARIGNRVLIENGENLSAVLYALHEGSQEEKQSLKRLLDWIKQLPDEPYSDFKFEATKIGDVIFGFREGKNGHFVDARLVSDGTLRTLSILTAMETAPKDSMVVIEEFDNGLHPSRIHILIKAIDECCRRRRLKALATTHNPATLNSLEREQMRGVVLCFSEPEQHVSRLLRLKDLPRSDELLERGRLGDLVTRRVVEQYLAPDYEEKRKVEMLEWLRGMK